MGSHIHVFKKKKKKKRDSYHFHNSSLQRSRRSRSSLSWCRNRCHVHRFEIYITPFKKEKGVSRFFKGESCGGDSWSEWLFYWKPKWKKAERRSTHTLYRKHTVCHAYTHVKTRPGPWERNEWERMKGASPPHERSEVKTSGARRTTRQHSVNLPNAAFTARREFLTRCPTVQTK